MKRVYCFDIFNAIWAGIPQVYCSLPREDLLMLILNLGLNSLCGPSLVIVLWENAWSFEDTHQVFYRSGRLGLKVYLMPKFNALPVSVWRMFKQVYCFCLFNVISEIILQVYCSFCSMYKSKCSPLYFIEVWGPCLDL